MSHCWKNSSCVVLVSPFLRDMSYCFWMEIQGCEGKKAVLIHCSDLPQTGNFWTMKTFSVVYKKIPSGEQKCTLISITLQFSNHLFPWRGSFFAVQVTPPLSFPKRWGCSDPQRREALSLHHSHIDCGPVHRELQAFKNTKFHSRGFHRLERFKLALF